jgi:hypothetical protein
MKKQLLIFAMLAAMTFVGMPAGSAVAAYGGSELTYNGTPGNFVAEGQPGRRRRVQWRKKTYPSRYRNYGQYRRTQVGNRRYRLVRRYYRNNDGIRLSRWIRVYY